MSFGFSIGDFLEVAKLIEATRKRFKGAPTECSALAAETKLLQIVVNDINVQIEDDDDIADAVRRDMQSAVENCNSVLTDLNALLDSRTELTSKPGPARKVHQRVWKRLKWDSGEVNKLRSRLSLAVQLLESVRRRVDSTLHHDSAQGVKRLPAAHDNEEVLRVANWLASATYLEQQNDYFSKVHPGTGQWLLTHSSYLAWRNGSIPTLVLPGIPGAGKTFLASVLVNDLQKHVSEGDNAALAFFYSNFRRTDSQSTVQIISSIIRQLFLHQPQRMDAVKSMYKAHHDRLPATKPSLEELALTSEKALSTFSKVSFVIDALDECNGPDEAYRKPWQYLLTLLFRLQEEWRPRVSLQILVSFRPILEIDNFFPRCERLAIHASEDDLAVYCGAIIPKISCITRKAEMHSRISRAICKSAQGMFLLAKLHCDNLAAKTKPKDVLQALEKFAQGGDALSNAYEDTMQRIRRQSEDYTELARKVLICITFSARPLSLNELRHAIAVDEGTKELDPEDDLDDPDALISSCAGLVTIDPESKTVRLVHYTTQKFLESLQNGFLSGSHYFLASCCLNYLLLNTFAEGHTNWARPMHEEQPRMYTQQPSPYVQRIGRFPFLEYSAQFWARHMALAPTDTYLRLRAFTFLDHFGHVASALEALHERGPLFDHSYSPVHLLAAMGSDQMLEDYTNRGYPSDGMQNDRIACQKCKHRTSKHVDELKASQLSWKEAITSLKDHHGRTPLATAAGAGHPSTVALLLNFNKALINERDGYGRTPLYHALYCHYDGALSHDHEAIALRLLGEPAILGPWYGDLYLCGCLPVAAGGGSEAVVDKMLQLAVDTGAGWVDATALPSSPVRSKAVRDALESAAGGGHLGMVKKLWRYSCDEQLHFPAAAGEKALRAAVKEGRLEIVQYLMDQKYIRVDGTDCDGMSVLHHAASEENVHIFDYNLKKVRNIDIDLAGKRTALSYAAEIGHLQVAQILVSGYNANVDFAHREGMTSIMHTARYSQLDMLAFLAPLVSDLNSTDAMGGTVVHHLVAWADIWSHNVEEFRSSLECLVKHGAALDVKDNTGRTPYERVCDREKQASKCGENIDNFQPLKEVMEQMLCNPTVP